MPNPKTGTVTDDTAKAVAECKAGRVEFKVDKGANLHVVVGKLSFDEGKLRENARSVIDAIVKARPSSSKGRYIENCVIASTFSPGVQLSGSEYSN
jgi:large subunit ribosomal protein L1